MYTLFRTNENSNPVSRIASSGRPEELVNAARRMLEESDQPDLEFLVISDENNRILQKINRTLNRNA